MAKRPIFIDLNAPVHLSDVPDLARRAVWWWLGELGDMMPAGLGRIVPRQAEETCLFADNGTWRLKPAGGDASRVVTIDASSDDKGVADQILRAAPDFSLSRLVVVLPSHLVLRRQVELPLMPDRQLASAIELQTDRLTPFKSENVRLAVKVISRDGVDGKASVDCAFVPRPAVDALEQRLLRFGFKASRIDVAGDDGEPAGFDLKPVGSQERASPSLLQNAGFLAGVAVAWYLAGSMWDLSRSHELETWQERITALRPQAMQSAALRGQLDALIAPYDVARKHDGAAILNLLKALTDVVPDSARISEMKLEGDVVEIGGLASNAAGLIATLEASPKFKDVKFRSQVVRRPDSNKDRFEISFRLEGAER